MKEKFVSLKEILRKPDLYFAHSKEDGQHMLYETLEEHTKLCQLYFEKLCKSKQIETKIKCFYRVYMGETSHETEELFDKMWRNIVTFHDVGKVNPLFQKNVLKRNDVEINVKFNLLESRHSVLSSVIYMNYYWEKAVQLESYEEAKRLITIMMCNAYLISRHHSELVSVNDFLVGKQKDEIVKAIEVLKTECEKICNQSLIFDQDCFRQVEDAFRDEKRTKKQIIWLYFYEKLLYSLLVAADYYATTEYVFGVKTEDFGELENISEFYEIFQNTEINQSIREYEKTEYPMSDEQWEGIKNINILRKEIFLETEKNLLENLEKSIYYVEAPTGSGKSNLSMNLSFQLANRNLELKKIYYIYPFNTLIEQNQEIMEKTFGNNPEIMKNIAVVNSITPIKQVSKERRDEENVESGLYYQRALLNRQFLNYPVILTTHISLFDTIFGNSKESAFGFHQLAGSILILDEIQSYRNKIWGEIITFLTEMAEFLHMKIIIMSATLPNLTVLNNAWENTVYLVKNRDRFFQHPCFKNRVMISRELLDVEMTMEKLLKHVKGQCGKGKKILIEFIRKRSAEEFYQRLMEENDIQEPILCMTGDDSILERKQMIKRVKEAKEIILVSTQVIEAGVDIDMDIGYKAIAKMDSEEQFMGRFNRSFTEGKTGVVYFFQMDDPKKIYGEDSRTNPEFGIMNEDIWKCLKEKNFSAYYEKIMAVWQKNYSEKAEIDFYSNMLMKLDFPKVKEEMQLINKENWKISVYLGRIVLDEKDKKIDGRKIWNEYKSLLYNSEMDYAEKKVKLSEVTSKMNYFMYQVQQIGCTYTEQIGELFYIENGEEYIVNGKLNRVKIEGQLAEFI